MKVIRFKKINQNGNRDKNCTVVQNVMHVVLKEGDRYCEQNFQIIFTVDNL